MAANVEMFTYTKILDDKTVEKGTLKMQRQKGNEVRAIVEFSGAAEARVIAFLGKDREDLLPEAEGVSGLRSRKKQRRAESIPTAGVRFVRQRVGKQLHH